MKRKWIAILTFLLCVGGSMTACGGGGTLQTDALADVTRIEVQSGSTGQFVSVTDADTLQTLTGYFAAHTFSKEGVSPEETEGSYRLKCYDAERELKATLDVVAADQVCSDGMLYAAEADDAIDMTYLREMLTGRGIDASMSIKEGTLTPAGATLVIGNHAADGLMYGSNYTLERKVDGAWKDAKILLEDYGFTLEAYGVGPHAAAEQDVHWEWLYGALRPGEYRILKDVSITLDGRPVNADKYYLFATFEID